jgi:hypothetical protein
MNASRLVAAAATVLAAAAAAPSPAFAQESNLRGTFMSAELRPLGERTERGIAHIRATPKSAGIIAILIGLTDTPPDPSGNDYSLRLARQPCRVVRRQPSPTSYVSRNLLNSEVTRPSHYLDDTDIVLGKRWRKARSMVLLYRDGGNFAPRACGTAFYIDDIIIG